MTEETQAQAIAALVEKLPDQLKPVGREYGPALLKMSTDDLWNWIKMLIQGRKQEAYQEVLEKTDSALLANEWEKLNAEWAEANKQNAADLAIQKEALNVLLKALLAIAVSLIGL